MWDESESCLVVSDSLWPNGLYSPGNSSVKNIGVGSLSLFQGIFPTQGSNPGLPHCRRILYQLSHQGSPRIREWVADPFSRGSSQPSYRTGISCIAGGFFTNWAIREALFSIKVFWGVAHMKHDLTYYDICLYLTECLNSIIYPWDQLEQFC